MQIWVVTADDYHSYQIIGAASSEKLARKIAREHKEKFKEYTNIHEVECEEMRQNEICNV